MSISTPPIPLFQSSESTSHPVVFHPRREGGALAPAPSRDAYALALNDMNAVQLATDARRDREHAKTMGCVQSTLEKTQKSFQPLVETNQALCKQLVVSEGLPHHMQRAHEAEVAILKEQIALQKQQHEETQQQLIKMVRLSEERAAAAVRAQVAAEGRATTAAREHAATIKAITRTSQAQMQKVVADSNALISNLQFQLDLAKTSQEQMQEQMQARIDANTSTISSLQTQLSQVKSDHQAALLQKDREAQAAIQAAVQATMQKLIGPAHARWAR